MAEKDPNYDPFVIEKIFPTPAIALTVVPPSLEELLRDAIVVLDANTLLAPFLVGTESLRDVEDVFTPLVKAGRLFLPAQAVREYARHRAEKIAEAHKHVMDRLSTVPSAPKAMQISMFEDVTEYKAVADAADDVRKAIREYKDRLDELEAQVRNWNWNDPVSQLYAKLFTSSQIADHGKKHEDLRKDLEHRVTHSIPPGFKDKGKADGGIGDVSIWHTILKLGEEKKKDLVFVTNDRKNDWTVRQGDQPLFPRFELVDEFHRASGAHFTLLQFSRFLKLLGAKPTTIAEVSAVTDIYAEIDALELDAVIGGLRTVVDRFLENAYDPSEEYHYISDIDFPGMCDRFDELLDGYLRSGAAPREAQWTFKEMAVVLNKLRGVNEAIRYEAARMHRDAASLEEKLRGYAHRFIDLHDRLG